MSVGLALVAVLSSIGIASWVVAVGSRQASREALSAPGPPTSSAQPERFSLPLAGNPEALTLAERSRDLLLGLAATPGGPVDLLAIPGRQRVARRALEASVGSRRLVPRPCGNGCFRLSVPVMTGRPIVLSVRVRRPGVPMARVRFRFPARLPPAGDRLATSVARRMGSLRSLQFDEVLSNGFAVVETHYVARAPDRLRFRTSQEQRTILIGDRRWDFENGRWVESSYSAVRLPSYIWEGARNARIVGMTRIGSVPVRVLSLFGAAGPIWFRLFVASDSRVLRAEMLTQSHFMDHRFRAYDEPVEIGPPA